MFKLGKLLKKDMRDENNVILFYDKCILFKFNKKYNIKWYLYNYFYFLKKGLYVPKLLCFFYIENYFIQEFIKNKNNFEEVYYKNYNKIYNYIFNFYNKNKVCINNILSIKTIRHCFYDNNSKNIGEFLISFLDFVKIKKNIKEEELNKLLKIKNKIILNYEFFNDEYIYFIHGDLNQSNILINDKGKFFFIDFENSGFFDYYYEYASLYIENKKLFLNYIKNDKNFNYIRFYINLDIYNLLDKIYNK